MFAPDYIDLVLIGGGHAHAQIIKMWAMDPLPGVRLSLVSPHSYTPYSGMLPGLLGGHYQFEQAHIDLRRLCAWAKVRYIEGAVTAIDTDTKHIQITGHPGLCADLLSINIGITPANAIPGAEQFAIGVKPIAQFHQQWLQLLQALPNTTEQTPARIHIIGAGIAGVESCLAMAQRIRSEGRAAKLFLLYPDDDILPELPARARRVARAALDRYGVQCLAQHRVQAFAQGHIQCSQERVLASDFSLLCTQAQPAQWPSASGISCDQRGFILLNDQLQSISHPWIFAAGDTAQQQRHPRPQAGVFAVRQGPVLFANLRRYAQKQPLKSFRPQQHFLKLMSLGDKQAVAIRNGFSLGGSGLLGRLMWRWKDRIDRQFMAQLQQLPTAMPATTIITIEPGSLNSDEQALDPMRCEGCGAKVGASILQRALAKLKTPSDDSIVMGLAAREDAAVFKPPAGKLMVQSVDSFGGMVSDPYIQGQLAALHALSDIFAMGATPHSAQALVTMASNGEAIVERDLNLLLQGAVAQLNAHRCSLIGGHTSEGPNTQLALCINGSIEPDKISTKANLQVGDKLILCKPLGSGILFAGQQLGLCQGPWIEAALAAMLQSNRAAAELAQHYGASACTDITGFGLLGHLAEMLRRPDQNTGLKLALQPGAIPLYQGVAELVKQGVRSSLFSHNLSLAMAYCDTSIDGAEPLCDPQTCGGLLVGVTAKQSDSLLQALRQSGYPQAAIIGECLASVDSRICLGTSE
ncbi:MAG: selenide, water dikinase SelD [Cellvibrionaceae bacterium]|nr:selenide, water dikinase SelD [Cellvibrionaceae bacterium]